jgi:hypothetical protein
MKDDVLWAPPSFVLMNYYKMFATQKMLPYAFIYFEELATEEDVSTRYKLFPREEEEWWIKAVLHCSVRLLCIRFLPVGGGGARYTVDRIIVI